MIEVYPYLVEIDCLKRVYKGFVKILIKGLLGVIAFVYGLQKRFRVSGGFVEGLWRYEHFVEPLVEAYGSTPSCDPVVWVLW